MTRENAIKKVKELLKDAGLGEMIKVSSRQTGIHGDAQCIYIEPIPVRGNGELIKKLKTMPDFYGHKSLNFENKFEFWGRFDIV